MWNIDEMGLAGREPNSMKVETEGKVNISWVTRALNAKLLGTCVLREGQKLCIYTMWLQHREKYQKKELEGIKIYIKIKTNLQIAL